MLNTDPDSSRPEFNDAAVEHVMQRAGRGALALVALATAVVLAVWLAFYLFLFLPRGPAS